MKNILITILFLIALPASARVNSLTGETYEILTDYNQNPTATVVLEVDGFPSWQDCQNGKVKENCNHQDAWRLESRQIWQDCKDGKDISEITDYLDCSQKTYEEFLDQRVKEKKEAILQNEQVKIDSQNLVEKNQQLEARITELEKKVGIVEKIGNSQEIKLNFIQKILDWLINIFK